MLTHLLLGTLSLLWLGSGLALIVIPTQWVIVMQSLSTSPFPRFLLAQVVLISSLVLLIGGAGLPLSILWITLGGLGLLNGLWLVIDFHDVMNRATRWLQTMPSWSLPLTGLFQVTLSILLLLDLS